MKIWVLWSSGCPSHYSKIIHIYLIFIRVLLYFIMHISIQFFIYSFLQTFYPNCSGWIFGCPKSHCHASDRHANAISCLVSQVEYSADGMESVTRLTGSWSAEPDWNDRIEPLNINHYEFLQTLQYQRCQTLTQRLNKWNFGKIGLFSECANMTRVPYHQTCS